MSLSAAVGSVGRYGRRHRALLTVVGTLGMVAALVSVLAGQRDEFTYALSRVAGWTLAVARKLARQMM